jgi:hypothetical protein
MARGRHWCRRWHRPGSALRWSAGRVAGAGSRAAAGVPANHLGWPVDIWPMCGHAARCHLRLNGSITNPVPAAAIARSSSSLEIFRATSMERVSRKPVHATIRYPDTRSRQLNGTASANLYRAPRGAATSTKPASYQLPGGTGASQAWLWKWGWRGVSPWRLRRQGCSPCTGAIISGTRLRDRN